MTSRSKARRRPLGSAETLEPRLALAVTVVSPLADITVPASATSQTISVAGRFNDTAVTGTVVQFSTNAGAPNDRFFVELFDQAGPGRSRTTPQTAANFLSYADRGDYTNTIIHRSIPGFVVQGGGFRAPTAASNQSGGVPTAIAARAAVVNEPGNSNVRGTIAMAKLGDDPNSATNQWFFNLADNNDPLNPDNLDAQNGGFTAFGRVLGAGMTAVDAMASVPRYNRSAAYGGAFGEVPLRNAPSSPLPDGYVVQPSQFVTMPLIRRVGELVYTVTSSDPSLVTASFTPDSGSTDLRLDYAAGRSGTSVITVRAASVFDPADFKEDQFTVVREAVPFRPLFAVGAEIGASSTPVVRLVDAATGVVIAQVTAFEPAFRGGVRVALGDLDADGTAEVVAASGPGRVGEIRVFRQQTSGSATILAEIPAYRTFPFGTTYTGGVEISVGDLDGDAREDLVAAMSRGGGTVSAFRSVNAADPIENAPYRTFTPFGGTFDGGATVTVADVGTFAQGRLTSATAADGRMEIVVGSGVGMRSTVLVYDISAAPRVVSTILPFPVQQVGGVFVSAGRLNTDSIDDIVVASGRGGGAVTRVYNGRVDQAAPAALITSTAFAGLARPNAPVFMAPIDLDGDGKIDRFYATQGDAGGSQGVLHVATSGARVGAFGSLQGPLRIAAFRRFARA
ncbi:MAG: peptidylprolyl isomerase [Planctomycetia bacterium]